MCSSFPLCSEVEATGGTETVMGPGRQVHKPGPMTWIAQETDEPHQKTVRTPEMWQKINTQSPGSCIFLCYIPLWSVKGPYYNHNSQRSVSGGQKSKGSSFKYLWLFSSFNLKFRTLRKPRPQSYDWFSSFSLAKPQVGGKPKRRTTLQPRVFRNETMAWMLEDDYYQVIKNSSKYKKKNLNLFETICRVTFTTANTPVHLRKEFSLFIPSAFIVRRSTFL